ncbi:MAG: hypothetical protein QOJ32_1009 [Frankiaceae bacterium]|nr:hypothetical protein [Frankiaceae bacterium]
MSAWSLRRRLAGLLSVVAVLLLVLVSASAVLLVQVHRDQNLVIKRYFSVLSDSNALFLNLVDAETAVRGYILSGNDADLQPLRALQSPDFRVRGEALQRNLGRNPQLVGALNQTSRSIGEWYRGFVQPSLDQVRTRGPRSVSNADLARGRAAFDVVRADYAAYRTAVLERRNALSKELDRKTNLLFAAVVTGAVGAVVLGLLLGLALLRWVTRPLDALAAQTRAVRSGELEPAIEIDGPPEIAALGSDVELMRRSLVEQLAAVHAARDGLEQAQHRLETQAEELTRSNRDLEQFAYVASHDLQEPLRKVASFCQLLERRYAGQLDERADQYIAFAVDGAKRMQQLINDLLSFSRIGRRTSGRAEVELETCFDGALRNLAASLEESGATVDAGSLPRVWGEKALLTALLQNLISNAVKFRGDQPVAVRLTCEPGDGEYVFRCADNGIGIEPQYADRIFIIFQRLHAKDEYAGTGIGLAMCKKIVEWHGGRIWLDVDATGPGRGTTFAWTLPTAERGRAIMEPAPDHVADPGTDREKVSA